MAALEGKVKLPGVGEVSKKGLAIGGGVGVAIVAVVVIRKKATANTTAPATTQDATSTDQTDPAGNVGAIDPVTGYVYGSPEDEQVLAQGNAGSFSDLGVGGTDLSGIDPNTGIPFADEIGSGGSGTGSTSGSTTAITTREQWVAQAENDMNAPALATVAPMIWAGIAVSKADKDLFLEAVALEGSPPGGYPTPIKLTDTAGHPAPGTGDITVPNVRGEHGEDARRNLEAAGFKVTQSPPTTPKGKITTVESQSPAGGKKAKKGTTVHITVKAA